MTRPPAGTPGDDRAGEPPSKSERKRTAHAAQDLGEALLALRDAELDALGLPELLIAAVREARRIRSRAASARQRQYIGKLMRGVDPEPIRRALAVRNQHDAEEIQRFKRAENWRQRLIEQGEPALDALARLKPELDRSHWARLVRAARDTAPGAGRAQGGAGRELFRALRVLLG